LTVEYLVGSQSSHTAYGLLRICSVVYFPASQLMHSN
jgi:hypothetical protein